MSLSASDVIDATRTPILEFTRGWMVGPLTAELVPELGLDAGFGPWVCGRAGVLGEVAADVAAAGIGFMHPAAVRRYWEHRPAGLTGEAVAARYIACAYRWAPEALAALPSDDLDQLDRLGRVVIDAALPSVGLLFAGWRRVAPPREPACRVALTLHVLRELRGGAHLSAVHAAGLGPLGSIMASDPPRGGVEWAGALGWPGPYPTADPAARAEAERLTTVICEPAYDALAAEDRQRFVDLVLAARATIA
jgi:hypothetical protein